jgi:hypothetical protein
MSAFHPLQTLASVRFRPIADVQFLEHHPQPMTDPFRTAALRARITAAGALAFIAALILAISSLHFGTAVTHGQVVKAEVLRLGTHPAARVAGGDLPIITVRLPDGSIRDVQATWADVNGCKPGRSISLLQQGKALQVGQPGCISGH